MKNQIIVFINPIKFSHLLDDKSATIQFYELDKDENPVYLNGSNHLVYIDRNGQVKVEAYSETEINKASIILIPDEKIIDFIPKDDFKILYHSITEQKFPNQYNRLKGAGNCKGCFKDIESANTVYHKITQFINTDGSVKFQEIWDSIPVLDLVLEAKLELLHNCLHHESVPPVLNDLLSNYALAFETFNKAIKGKTLFDKDYINALTELRKALLGS